MPQRDILPTPAGTGRAAASSSSDPRLYDPHGRHYRCENESEAARALAPKLSAPQIFDCLDLFDSIDLTSPGRKHADRRCSHNGGREPTQNGQPLRQREVPHDLRA
jgi:hypothetical protein